MELFHQFPADTSEPGIEEITTWPNNSLAKIVIQLYNTDNDNDNDNDKSLFIQATSGT